MSSRRLAVVAAAALLLPAAIARSSPLPGALGCPIFPASNPWNQRVDTLPVDPDSAAYIASIGLNVGLHADFGSGLWDGGPIGIPITVVDGPTTPWSSPTFDYDDQSDAGPYPIPADVAIEGGPSSTGDRHAIIVDRSACKLYELYALYPGDGGWTAGSGAIWDLHSNAVRPAGWTSADAAGLPILPGLARYEEVAAGAIDHALRFTVQYTRRAYIYPARHYASSLTDPALPPMGLRVRLKAAFDTSRYGPQARVVLQALKRYGMMVADNGSNWYISGAPDPRWDNDDLHGLGGVKGSDFEVVDTSSLQPPPTAVAVTSFSARRTPRGVRLTWRSTGPGVLAWTISRGGVAIGRVAAAGRGLYRFLDPAPPRRVARYAVEALLANGLRIEAGSTVVHARP